MPRTVCLTLPLLLTVAALALSACGPTRPDAGAAAPATASPPNPSEPGARNHAAAMPPQHSPDPRPVRRAQQAYPSQANTETVEPSPRAPSAVLGRVTSVETLLSQSPPNSGAGAVIGGLLGGVLGHQVGGGNGNTAATVLGAVGGAVAGNSMEKTRSRDVIGYRVHVQLDNGQTRQVTLSQPGRFSAGERVRFVGDQLEPA